MEGGQRKRGGSPGESKLVRKLFVISRKSEPERTTERGQHSSAPASTAWHEALSHGAAAPLNWTSHARKLLWRMPKRRRRFAKSKARAGRGEAEAEAD